MSEYKLKICDQSRKQAWFQIMYQTDELHRLQIWNEVDFELNYQIWGQIHSRLYIVLAEN